MNENLIKEFLDIQYKKDSLLELIENKFKIEIPGGSIQNYTKVKWRRKLSVFNCVEIYKDELHIKGCSTEIFSQKEKDTDIIEYDDFIIFNCYRSYNGKENWFYIDNPQCIVLLKSNETINN